MPENLTPDEATIAETASSASVSTGSKSYKETILARQDLGADH